MKAQGFNTRLVRLFGQITSQCLADELVSPVMVISLFLSHVALGLTTAIVVRRLLETSTGFYWFGVLFVVVASGALVRGLARAFPERRATLFFILAVATEMALGIIWAIGVFLFFPAGNTSEMVVFMLLLAGIGGAASIPQHANLLLALSALGPAMPLLSAHMLFINANVLGLHALVMLSLWATMIFFLVYLNHTTKTRRRWRIMQDELLARIEEKARLLEEAKKAEQQARREAEQANAAKSRFLAHSSHDLRQPLHACRLLLETLNDDALDPGSIERLGRVKQSLDYLAKLFDSLLDLTMLDTGNMAFAQRSLALNDVFEQMHRDFAPMAAANEVGLRIVSTSLWVRSDPIILRRIVQNLVANAIQHARGGKVLLGGRRRAEGVCLLVCDTGTGIAKSDQQGIFEEFAQLNGDKGSNLLKGLGLGLSIVQRMAALAQLQISVRSEPGRGSTFALDCLQRIDPGSLAAGTAPVHHPVNTFQNIALIDDDPNTLFAMQALLSKWGNTVFAFQDAAQARDCDSVDVLICDYELGGDVDGVEVIAEFQEHQKRKVPALLITANTSGAVEARARKYKIPVLYKPVRPAQLRSALLSLGI